MNCKIGGNSIELKIFSNLKRYFTRAFNRLALMWHLTSAINIYLVDTLILHLSYFDNVNLNEIFKFVTAIYIEKFCCRIYSSRIIDNDKNTIF